MRRAVQPQARLTSRTVSVPAPVRGLVLAQSPARPGDMTAEILQNWIPTDRGIRMRGGLQAAATTGGDAVKSLFAYNHPSNAALFAATTSAIYDISGFDPATAPPASVAGQSVGYYSAQQIGTVGGDFLYVVNGSDLAQIYDGASWNPVSSVAVNEIDYDAKTGDFIKGQTLTGATSGATAVILGVTPATSTTGTLKIGTVTGGPYVDNEALTAGGGGAAVANGANSVASTIAVTGVLTDALSAVWLYANRLFFVEKDTLTAWYLGVDAVGGTANDFSLAGVFQRGGALLFGASWSLDSGDGMDDKCVCVSTEGEVAIYSGTDPSDAAAWRLEGRYDIAKPLGVNAFMRAGGDLLIATTDGVVPLSAVVQKDPAALSMAAITRPIETLWRKVTVAASEPIELVKWADRGIAFVTLPEQTETLTTNLNTGAWARQVGWGATCGATFLSKAYIGQADGSIVAIDETGYDIDQPYTCRANWAFDDFRVPTTYKTAQLARVAYFAPVEMNLKVSASGDYRTDFPTAPDVAGFTETTDYMVWDVDNWDEKLWWDESIDAATAPFTTPWVPVSGSGRALAAQVQATSGQAVKPNLEIIRVDVAYQEGGWGT